MSEERQHHPFSPSKLGNCEACPAYEGKSGTNVAAETGTRQHGVAESGDDDHRLDDDKVAAVADCMDFFARQKQLMVEAREREVVALATRTAECAGEDAGAYLDEANQCVGPVQEFKEIYLAVDTESFQAPVWDEKEQKFVDRTVGHTTGGYIDCGLLAHTGTYAELFDWKFGKWAVEDAEKNVQGICYVLGFFREHPDVQTVKFFFKQPALDTVTWHEFHRMDIPALLLRVKTIVARKVESNRKGDFSMANPLTPVCLFCGRLGQCTKVLDIALDVAKKFYPLAIPASVTPTMVQDPVNAGIGMRLAGTMAVWADAFKRQTTDRVIRRGCGFPEGYSLATRADREVIDAAKMLVVAKQFVTEQELAGVADYPITRIEEIINDTAPRGMKKSTVEKFQAALIDSKAVKKGTPYSFLRAVASKKEDKPSDE